ncbi:MAG: AP2 domain-containing protein [Luteolibacter sp.]
MEPSRDSRGIVRLDQPKTGTYGWQVRLQRGGIKFARYFADRAAGGPQASFEQACIWRDELLERFAREAAQARVCRTSSRNSSGVVGVSRIAIAVSNGTVYYFWQASWSPAPGTRRSIRFSVKRHGEKQAFRLAVEARREATGL